MNPFFLSLFHLLLFLYQLIVQFSFLVFLPRADLINQVLKLDGEIKTLAQELYKQKSIIVMGRGHNYATCLEGALVCPESVGWVEFWVREGEMEDEFCCRLGPYTLF